MPHRRDREDGVAEQRERGGRWSAAGVRVRARGAPRLLAAVPARAALAHQQDRPAAADEGSLSPVFFMGVALCDTLCIVKEKVKKVYFTRDFFTFYNYNLVKLFA